MKRALGIFVAVLLLTPLIVLAWLTTTESGLRWAYQHAESYLPAELAIHKLEGRLIGPITLKGVGYQQDGTVIKAEQIILEWLPGALLAANVDISRLHIQSLKIILPQLEKTDQSLNLPEINLPWRVALKDVVVDDFSVSQNEQTFALKQIRLNATTLFSQIDIEDLSIEADTFNLNIKGELRPTRNYRHELEIHWQTELPSSAVIKGRGQLIGDLGTTRIKQHLTGPLQLVLNAEINDLLDRLNWHAKVDVSAFDASKLAVDWPAVSGKVKLEGKGELTTASLAGTLNGDYPELGPFDARFKLQRLSDNTVRIEHLMLHTPVSNTHLHAHGQWMPGADGGDIALAVNWQNLRWPLKENETWFDSAIGSGWIEGNINQYRFGLATDRPWAQAPPSHWYASAEGNVKGLNFHSLRITGLDGETIAMGQLNWSPHLVWKAEVSSAELNPGKLWPEWPGQLNAKLTSSGHFENGQLIADADITQLTGKLRDYPISLRSRLGWRNNGLDINLFDFHSGSSQVSAQGRVADKLKLDWSITASNLAELYPQAQGQLRAKGLVTGSQAAPNIDASFNGKGLSLPDYEIGAIEGRVAVDLFRWQQVDIKLASQVLKIKGYALQSLNIDADTQHLEANAVSDVATALIKLKGEAVPQGWHGHIVRADIQSSRFDDWQLSSPATLNINKKTLLLEALCWQHLEARLCADLQRENETWKSRLEIKKLPLKLFSPWLPPDLKLDGVTDATADLQLHTPDQLLGQATIALPPGVVSYPLLEGERDRWEYRGGTVVVTLNHQGLEATSEIGMTNGDRFQGRLALPGVKPLAMDSHRQPLQANAQLSIQDLGLIEAIVPEVQDLRGEVRLTLAAAGTLAQPRLSGDAHLHNGTLRIPRLGLTIDQLSMKSQSDGFEKLSFSLNARSGDGHLAIVGQTLLDRSTGWPTSMTIKGEAFEVSRIPEARVLVSPELQITMQNRTIDIKGEVHIPYAKLQPKDITTAARVSNDVVVVGGEQPVIEKWSIYTKVRLTLGEQVSFYGFGFEGRFGGSLLLEDEPGQPTKATGEINVPEGRYRAYGQRLDVEHGRLLYTGGPLTNPGLDLRAVRHVSNVTAGLKVRGSLNQPQVELFSIPAMGQTDALAYLLLGRPIENASGEEGSMMAKAALALSLSGGDRLARTLSDRFGLDEMRVESGESGDQASLVVGRYLSPRLYVGYGVGLIEAVNTFNVRYQISDKWQLKGESGEHQGADLFYTIER